MKALCLTLALMLPMNLSAQQQRVRFERISLEHGLSQSIVRVIFQDSKGFLWFGAQDGLNKYDGYEFTVYKYDPFDSTSLSESDIWSIYEAPSEPKVLWIGTGASGLNRFDRETETFTHFRHKPTDSTSLSHDFVAQIFEDRARNLWVLTGTGGLDRLDRKTGKFTHYRHDPNNANSLSHNRITAFHESATEPGVLWIGTPAGLNRFDAKTGRFTRFRHEPDDTNSLSFDGVLSIYEAATEPGILWIGTGPTDGEPKGGGLNRLDMKSGAFTHYRHDPRNPKSISSDIVGPVYEDKHGMLWVGTLAGLDKFDRQAGTFTHFALNTNNPNFLSHAAAFIFADSKGYLWIRTPLNDGVHRFEPSAGAFIHCRFDPIDPRSLSNDVVFSIFEDRSGVLWLGTEAGGLNKLDQYAEKFKVFVPESNNPNSLSNFMVRAIHEDRSSPNILWIGVAQGGLNKLDRKTGRFTHFRHDPKNPGSLSNDNVWVIYEDRAGELWVGTLGGGLNKFDRHKETFAHYRHDSANPNSLSNDNVRAIYEDRFAPGVLWIGTDGGGLNRFDLKANRFTHWQNDPKNPHSLSNNLVRAIHQEQSGVLWLGTSTGGLNKFDPKTNGFKRYLHDSMNSNSLGGDIVQSIYADSIGVLWLGTYGGGLNRFDPKTEQFTVYTENNSGLSNNAVYATLPDDHGNLWLSTNAGVCKFNPQLNTFKIYDVDDGLQSREFNGQAFFKSPSGEMFFGGIIGLNAFHPESVKDNPIAPQIALTDFKLFNESVAIGGKSPLKKHISETDSIVLAYWQNDISFEFVALHYGRPENNQYAYKLENYDDEWRYAGTQRVATYTNLDPGKYIFRVKGSNNDGVWDEEGLSIRITITPPLWKTSAAYVVYTLLLIAGIVAVERLHRARLLAKEREKAYLREAELRAEAAEAKARAIQAENERKTLELEEARKLQLSMLPKTVPSLPNFDIAVYMQTANEVGGDYYDFMMHEDGTLTAAIGDATGHGLQAGTMVAATKSLFNSLAHMPHPVPILAEASHALRGMGFHNMYMAMTIAKFKERRLRLATAGMPYTLIYRAAARYVEEVELKGLPLGSFSDVQYQWKDLKLNTDDVVLFMSDGFSEMFNVDGEMLGEDRAKELLKEVGQSAPEQIIEHLVIAGKAWANGQPQNDDVTLVVVKVK
ncbi:SpoIIE family protein phosphatase [candidate division KSB1 bacterium]|nr:SpoIIE family protein phosphatase [candidate division KSB1 bacterium]